MNIDDLKPFFTILVPILLAAIAEVAKRLTQFLSERSAEKGTEDIVQSLKRAKAEPATADKTIPLEAVVDIETFLAKTENRVRFEVDSSLTKERCLELIGHAKEQIEKAQNNNNLNSLTHAYNLIKHAESLVISSQAGRWYVLVLLTIFVGMLSWLGIVTWNHWSDFEKLIILGIPFPVLLWGAIGSGTAPLHKYLRSNNTFANHEVGTG